jgi:murein DD-endopeptidase MepM/ murein hydrolase activator NlpD
MQRPGRRRIGPFLGLGLPVALLVLAGASSPWIAQRTPRFVFPALAAAGGGAALFALARAVARLARGERRLVPVVVGVGATVVFVVLPLTRVVGVLRGGEHGAPRVLAAFGDWLGSEGYPRLSRHRGLDVAARPGADVLAAADGRVTVARDTQDLCGLIIVVVHEPHDYRTVYCHSAAIVVQPGDVVTRGQRIGVVGTTGQRALPGFEHVHLELQRGRDSRNVEDPTPRIVGCFDAATPYPVDRLVLTYPVRC